MIDSCAIDFFGTNSANKRKKKNKHVIRDEMKSTWCQDDSLGELVKRLKTDSHCPTVALGESKKKKMFDFFSLNWLFYTCRKCKITADTKYTASHTQCILTVHIKVNLFRVSWPTVMFFMPRAGFICCAVVLIHRDLMLGSAQRRAIRFLGCDL